MSYAEKHHRLWTDTPDLCKDYAGVLREIVKRIKCKGDERPAGEKVLCIGSKSTRQNCKCCDDEKHSFTEVVIRKLFLRPGRGRRGIR